MLRITKSILAFSKSIRFKLTILPIHINKTLEEMGYEISADKTTWKYYMNLAGLKHFTNNDVKITVLETGTKESLTKELLEQYKYTKKELLKNETMYEELLIEYPDDLEYILGCLYPISIERAISAEEGDILLYNPTMIEENENIIEHLEKWLKNVISRWDVKSFSIVENLYPSALLGVIYSNIPHAILNIRLSNIKTSRVCEYFLEAYFNSNLRLWGDLTYLNKESIFWLYHNLDYIVKNVGKNKTLNTLVEEVFEKNGVGIGLYQINQQSLDLLETSTLKELPFPEDRHVISSFGLNNSYDISAGLKMSISNMTTLQAIEVDPLGGIMDTDLEQTGYDADRINESLRLNSTNTQNTRVLDVNVKDLFRTNPESLLDLVINNLVALIAEDKYTGLVDFVDPNETGSSEARAGELVEYTEPNNSQTYALRPYDGLLMLIYMLTKLVGDEERTINQINYFDVINTKYDLDSVLYRLFPDGYSANAIRYIDKFRPTDVELITTSYDMESYIKENMLFNTISWVMDSNSGNDIVSANIKQYLALITQDGTLTLSNTRKTPRELLMDQGIDYEIKNSYDIVNSIRSLLLALTNIKVDEYEEIRLSLLSYKRILDKLTSYTTQVIDTGDGVDNRKMIYSTDTKLYISKLGLLTVLDAKVEPLEIVDGEVNVILNDFRDESSIFKDVLKTPVFTLRNRVYTDGLMLIGHEGFIVSDRPTNHLHIEPKPMYDISGDDMNNYFFKQVITNLDPLEEGEQEANIMLSDYKDSVTLSKGNPIGRPIYTRNDPWVDGYGMMDIGNTIEVDVPKNHISLAPIPDYDISGDDMKNYFFQNVKTSSDIVTMDVETNASIVGKDTLEVNATQNIDSVQLVSNDDMSGQAISDDSFISSDKPTNTISIEEIKDK